MQDAKPKTGLILTGGGARAAYQVGVLAAIAQLRRDACTTGDNPFQVIAGTSAGAINAATLACQADDFCSAVDGLMYIWQNIHVDQVYAADSLGVIRSGAKWLTMVSLGWALNRWRRTRPRSLLWTAGSGWALASSTSNARSYWPKSRRRSRISTR